MGSYDSIIITLYKGRYEKKDERGIQYRTFGEFDYIRVLDAPISQENGSVDYFKLWERTEETAQNLNVGESCHNLYAIGVHTDDKDSFWEDKQPYFFMSLLQFKTRETNQIKERAEKLDEYLKQRSEDCKKFNYVLYYSLDSCDFVLFIKSKKYETGAKQIQELPLFPDNKKQCNSYCYSICGIDFDELLEHGQNEIFEKIMICFVVKDVVSYQNWYQTFLEVFPPIEKGEIKEQRHINYNRLGNEDVCINILKCNIKAFIEQMRAGGCMCMQNSDFQKGTMKLRIHFDTQAYIDGLPLSETKDNGTQKMGENECFYMTEYQEKVNGEAKRQLYPFVSKALEEVLRACSYLKKENFAEDVQTCIRDAINMLFIKMNEFWEQDWTKGLHDNQIVYNDSVVKVVQGIMSIVNGSLHTDRMFFQSPGFNAVLYDIPVKMLVFYNSFVGQLVDKLNDNKSNKQFCYLLCPDLYLSITIQKLFDNKNEYPRRRFLLGKIPVKVIFEPKRLMQELAHEVAHCVGDDIRLRDRRWLYTVAMFAEVIATSILSPSDDHNESEQILRNIYDKIGDERKQKMHEELTLCIKKYFQKEFKTKAQKDEFDYYQVKTVRFFEMYMKKLLIEDKQILLQTIENNLKQYYKSASRNIHEYIGDVSELVEIFRNNIEIIVANSNSVIRAIHTLTNESFADLIMCEVLGIDMDEYVDLFFNMHKEEINDPTAYFLNYSPHATAERIVSVVRCYDKKIGELQSDIDDEDYREYKRKLMVYSGECEDYGCEKLQKILPPAVIRNNMKYLRECRDKVKNECNGLGVLQQKYKTIVNENIQESVKILLNIENTERSSKM